MALEETKRIAILYSYSEVHPYVDELQGGTTAVPDPQSLTSLNVTELIVIRSLLQLILKDVAKKGS